MLKKKGRAYYPASTEDDVKGMTYADNQLLRARITGAKKARSYRELKLYFGSCRYIASLAINPDMNTQEKVDHLTRIRCGFVSSTVYDHYTKSVQFIPQSLSYENCDQADAHRFIESAIERHATLAGVKDVETYIVNLKELGEK
jgi:hypothetical protein